ncbi:peptidylprolyl isomerase [Neobacillus notoginsengisoli]|uniref:Foldase protein PrsA n=1 Tax=Neobacillus notoginsengisoli TaxID=1578198 RepID=A0A417YZ33_9BACI|nr:peptidylprolyl isomerase [Neobacillus notoginsengisoli]RHW43125.1 peptidylprolyl isomerase [Neobacillus notoginsengisoli]
MKKWMVALALTGGVMTLGACNNASNGGGTVAETKAGNISKDELYELMKDNYGEQALQQLVYDKVLSDKYKVTDKEIEQKIEEFKAMYGAQAEGYLAQYDQDEIKKMFKTMALQEKAALKDVKVTEKEMKEYYDNYKPEVKSRHILVKDEATAKTVKEKLDKGAKFEDLAKEYSTDDTTKENGGDLPWFQPGAGQMVPEFEDAAAKLKKNEISGPVKTEYGFHIIQVTDIKEKKSYDEMKKEIEQKLKAEKLTPETVDAAMQRELKAANVKIKDKDLKDALTTEAVPQQ